MRGAGSRVVVALRVGLPVLVTSIACMMPVLRPYRPSCGGEASRPRLSQSLGRARAPGPSQATADAVHGADGQAPCPCPWRMLAAGLAALLLAALPLTLPHEGIKLKDCTPPPPSAADDGQRGRCPSDTGTHNSAAGYEQATLTRTRLQVRASCRSALTLTHVLRSSPFLCPCAPRYSTSPLTLTSHPRLSPSHLTLTSHPRISPSISPAV